MKTAHSNAGDVYTSGTESTLRNAISVVLMVLHTADETLTEARKFRACSIYETKHETHNAAANLYRALDAARRTAGSR